MKPREYWVWVTNKQAYARTSKPVSKNPDFKCFLVREVREIDWDLIFTDYCLQTDAIDNFELIKQLVEKQIKGEV